MTLRRAMLALIPSLGLGLALALGACGSDTSGPSGPDAGSGSHVGPDAGLLPFMSACTVGHDEECATGLCFDFNSKGPHCTHACTVATDCEAPSDGCSGMGVCKAPGGGTGGGTGAGGG